MKKILALGFLTVAMCACGISQLKDANKVAEARDATIIVKMRSKTEGKDASALLAEQNSLLNEIAATVTANYRIRNRFCNIFNGFTIDVPSEYVSNIRYLSRVDKVEYDKFHLVESFGDGATYEIKLDNANATASGKTMEKPEGTNDGSGTFIAVLDTGFYLKTLENGTQEYHNVYAPLEGADVVVTQASLKAKIDAAGQNKFHGFYDAIHSTYYNSKVPFYYDYGGDVQGRTEVDYDVFAEGQPHGNHVASIAAGNAGAEYEGIAPKAQLACMKVFTTYMDGQQYKSGATATAVLNALEDCLVLGVDAINMSLGSNLNDFNDSEIVQETIRTLEKAGTFVCVAAGNEGKGTWSSTVYGYWGTDMVETGILSGYANNAGSMTVASTQADTQFYGQALMVDGVNIQYHDEVTNYRTTSGDVTYDPERHLVDLIAKYSKDQFDYVYVGGWGEVKDYNGIDVNGKVAIVSRGETTFREKVENATAKGAVAIGIVDNTTETEFNIRMSFGDDGFTPAIPVIFILSKDKDLLLNSESKKLNIVVNKELDNPNARTISDYSSDGMRYDLTIKPEISTPGENIKGAILDSVNAYESMSGTSMATPNFEGAVALMISNHVGDADYRKTINARLMSTAVPMRDNTAEANFTSVRRQGAGLVNLDAAINSKVYLNGLTANNEPSGRAKVELFNNEKIAVGNVDLKFLAVNEGTSAVTYTAKTYVMAPGTAELDAERYEDFAGVKFMTIQDQLVQTFTDTVTVNPGDNVINIAHQVDADKLAALDADFENGCILEGYVILEATDQKQLSIPFLGFYGNLGEVSPVEPFTFERDGSKKYSSDLLNYLLNVNVNKPKANYTSYLLTGYYSSTKKIDVNKAVLNNESRICDYLDENGNTLRSVGVNPYSGENDPDNIFLGNNGFSNTLVIQQYVTRSVNTNSILIKNKASGQVVGTAHLKDSMFGAEYEGAVEVKWPLYKSHLDTTYYDQGYYAHRAYAVVPIYSLDKSKNIVPYADGEYELIFSYDLAAGGTFEKKYNLTIESDLPTIASREIVNNGGKEYLRIRYNEKNLSYVNINGTKYEAQKDDKGYYVDILTSEYQNKSIYALAEDKSYAKNGYMFHLNDANEVMVQSQLLNSNIYDFAYKVTGENTANQVFEFTFSKNGSSYLLKGDAYYVMKVPAGLDPDTLKIYTINATGAEKELKYETKDGYISFTSAIRNFRFVSDGGQVNPGPSDSQGGNSGNEGKKGCGSSLILTTPIMLSVALIGSAIVLLKKKKER